MEGERTSDDNSCARIDGTRDGAPLQVTDPAESIRMRWAPDDRPRGTGAVDRHGGGGKVSHGQHSFFTSRKSIGLTDVD